MSDSTTDADDSSTVEPSNVETITDDAREQIVADLAADIGTGDSGVIDSHIDPGVDVWVRVGVDAWPDAFAALKTRGFDFFNFLSAIDWMPSPFGNSETDPFADDVEEIDTTLRTGVTGADSRFQVFARISDVEAHYSVTLKADVPESMEVPTIVPSFAGANWHERETHEMFGISFVGHPDMRNLYLPTEFEGYPLRKDFPLLARHIKPWPGIADVEPMVGEDDE